MASHKNVLMRSASNPVLLARASAVMGLPLFWPIACSKPASMAILMAAFWRGWEWLRISVYGSWRKSVVQNNAPEIEVSSEFLPAFLLRVSIFGLLLVNWYALGQCYWYQPALPCLHRQELGRPATFCLLPSTWYWLWKEPRSRSSIKKIVIHRGGNGSDRHRSYDRTFIEDDELLICVSLRLERVI